MTNNYSTNTLKSQGLPLVSYIFLLILAIIFPVIYLNSLSGELTMTMSLILLAYFAFTPLFIFRPITFLYFIFLATPTLRFFSQDEVFIKIFDFPINFNAIIDLSILFFSAHYFFLEKGRLLDFLKGKKFILFFLAFTIFCFASIIYSIDKKSTFEELVRLITVFFIFAYSYLAVIDKKSFSSLIIAFIFGALAPALVGFYQLLTGTGWYDATIFQYRIQGTFSHPATLAYYLLLIIPIIYARLTSSKNKIKSISYLFLLFFYAIISVLTFSRGGWIGLLMVILVYGIVKSKKLLVTAFVLLLITYLLVPTINSRVNDVFEPKYNSSFSTRLFIIETTLPAFYNAPLLGYGWGSFESIHLKYNSEAIKYESQQAHNDYLRMGLQGLLYKKLVI